MIQQFLIKLLLSPVALLYGIGILLRNMSYRLGLIRTASFNIPVIGIGNLSIGGAGKTPHIEYLIRLLSPYIKLATLSRGYKRNTVGFRIANPADNALTIGDEPYMYHLKFRQVHVAVAENRAIGIPQLLGEFPEIQTILLDDHFQHRSVKPGLNILLTDYAHPYDKDFLLPVGRLREWPSGAERADIIIVTKCPQDLSLKERQQLKLRLARRKEQKIFFSYYQYGRPYSLLTGQQRDITDFDQVVLLSAIANEAYLHAYIEKAVTEVRLMSYEDHHLFTPHEISLLKIHLEQLEGEQTGIITTEKDATRLMLHRDYIIKEQLDIYLLPIEVKFLTDYLDFDETIKSFLLNFTV